MLTDSKLIIHRPEEITSQWVQQIVNHYARGITINQTTITHIDIGTTTRVAVKVEHSQPQKVPQYWFIKLPSKNWRARLITALPQLLATEIRFYQQVSATTPLIQPQVLFAASRFGYGSTLVLTDVREQGANPGLPQETLSLTQAKQVVSQLAIFHAHFYPRIRTDKQFDWLSSSIRTLEDRLGSLMALPLTRLGLKKAGDLIPINLHSSILNYARHRRQAMCFLSQPPFTLLHHDCHPGNLYWQQNQPGFLDWQMVRTGEGISDIAYFMATSLSTDMRRTYESILLQLYQKTLAEQGHCVDFDHLKQRYQAQLVYPFEAMLVTLAIGGMMTLDANIKLLARATAAVQDYDSFSCLQYES